MSRCHLRARLAPANGATVCGTTSSSGVWRPAEHRPKSPVLGPQQALLHFVPQGFRLNYCSSLVGFLLKGWSHKIIFWMAMNAIANEWDDTLSFSSGIMQ